MPRHLPDWPHGYLTSREAQDLLDCDRVTLHRLARQQRRIRVQEVGTRLAYCAEDVQRVAAEEQATAIALEQMGDDYLFVDEVVERLGCSEDYPYILALRGRLTTMHIGTRQVFPRAEVEALQERQAQQAQKRQEQERQAQERAAQRAERERVRQEQAQARRERERKRKERERTQKRAQAQRQLPDGYLTSREAVERLGITRQAVAQLAERGRIRTTRAANKRTVGYLAEDVVRVAAERADSG